MNYSVFYARAPNLLMRFEQARDLSEFPKTLQKLGAGLLIIDDWGLQPLELTPPAIPCSNCWTAGIGAT